MKRTKSAGGVVINEDNQIVVVSQYGETWSLPKGHVKDQEDLLETAKREIYEETGIPATNLTFLAKLGSYKRVSMRRKSIPTKELKEIVLFLFRTTHTNLSPIDPDNPEARWVEIDKVSTLLTHKLDKNYFDSIIPLIQKHLKN